MTVHTAVEIKRRPNIRNGDRKWDRIFFSFMSLLMLATVLFGFSRTYFLAGMVRAPLPNRLIHVHGAAFTLWIVLLLVQNALIVTHNVKVHRKLGIAGFLLAVLMVILGVLAAVDSLRRGFAPRGLDAMSFFVIPMSDMLLFSLFVFCAYKARFNAESHKRLILVSTIALVNAGVGRWPVTILHEKPFLVDFVLFGFLFMILGYDLLSLHRVSRTTVWASAIFILIHLSRVPLGMTSAWHSFAKFMLESSV
jgi:hypothetical protein